MDRPTTGSGRFDPPASTSRGTTGTSVSGTSDRGSGGASQAAEKAKGAATKAQQTAETAKAKAGAVTETAKAKAGQVTEQAAEKADVGIDKAAGGLDKLADTIRDKTADGQAAAVQGQASMVAEKLDATANYLRDKDTDQLVSDLEALVRRKPVQSVGVAVGIGFLLSKALR